jgi:protein gp37
LFSQSQGRLLAYGVDRLQHCYAETWANRWGKTIWGPAATTEREYKKAAWKDVPKWNAEAKAAGVRRRVFVQSMSDFFEDHPQVAPWRAAALRLMTECTSLDFQVLTKRPENINRMIEQATGFSDSEMWFCTAPHVWIGTTVENQEQADKRIPELLKVPAAVCFLSCEPLLGPVDLAKWIGEYDGTKEYGGSSLSSGGVGGDSDQRKWRSLADGTTQTESLDERDDVDSLQEAEGGARPGTISDGASSDRREEISFSSASPDLATFQREDTGWHDNQSQEREQKGQSPKQSRVSNLFGADSSCNSCSGENTAVGREEPSIEIDGRGSESNTHKTYERGEADGSSGVLWGCSADYIKDRTRREALGISWCIVGGESGPNARPMHPEWARSLRNQCQAAGVAFHFKQWGEWLPISQDSLHVIGTGQNEGKYRQQQAWFRFDEHCDTVRVGKRSAGRLLDGVVWDQFPEGV